MADLSKEKCPETIQELKEENPPAHKRWKGLFETIDNNVNFHEWAINIKQIKDDISNPDRFCTSSEWMSWQYLRILHARQYFDEMKLHTGGQLPADENFERSRMDMEYIWLLAKADILLTKDKEMKAIAEAAFPKKSVFAGIEEFMLHKP